MSLKFRWETEFKETEIGQIPREWEVESLRWAVKSLESGNRPKGGVLKHEPTGILSIGGENITWQGDLRLDNCLRFSKDFYNSLTRGKIEKEDILLVKDGATIGKLAFIKEVPEDKAMVNEHVFLIKTTREKYNPTYLFYYLSSEGGQSFIESSIGGSAQGGINKSILDTIKIPKLNLPEQTRIATILSYFDDLIENKKKQNEISEKTAMAIFKNWFVDFEPFKDGEFVDSELGKIPKGWEVKRLGEVVIGFKGVSYNSPDICLEPSGNIFITLNNFLRGGGFKTEYIYYIGNKA
ncbi:MAG: restriction endonuclease subunit S, partial [Candidatus Altiarchaeota archaeon]